MPKDPTAAQRMARLRERKKKSNLKSHLIWVTDEMWKKVKDLIASSPSQKNQSLCKEEGEPKN